MELGRIRSRRVHPFIYSIQEVRKFFRIQGFELASSAENEALEGWQVSWSAKSGQNRVVSFLRHERHAKRRKYDAAFRAESLRLAEQSRSTQAAARALNIDPKRLYQWQKAAQTPAAAALGPALDPATAAELRQLRAMARRQAQELAILKKAIAVFSNTADQ